MSSLVEVIRLHKHEIDSSSRERGTSLTSDKVLKILSGDLKKLGFSVEKDKTSSGAIRRPVFFGENGVPTKTYSIDAYHDEFKVGLEIEAGRGTKGNAVYRDLIQTCLLVDVDFLALAVLNEYKYGSTLVEHSYDATREILDAVYGSPRLRLPMKGILLIGY